jgi:hypothetical protein
MNPGSKDSSVNSSAHYFKELVILCEKQSFQVMLHPSKVQKLLRVVKTASSEIMCTLFLFCE